MYVYDMCVPATLRVLIWPSVGFVSIFGTIFHIVQFLILLPQPLKCWEDRHVPLPLVDEGDGFYSSFTHVQVFFRITKS